MSKLTRAEMEQIISHGGSVMHKGRIITTIENLPSKAELAAGDPVEEARTAREIDDEIKRLEAERSKLRNRVPESEPSFDESILGKTVPEISDHIESIEDLEELAQLYEAESDREVPRKGVIEAVEKRQAELQKK